MAATGPITSSPNTRELFHQAFDKVMLHAMLVCQKKSEYPTLQGCFSVLEQHGQKWMDRYLKDASLVNFPDIGWRRIPQKDIVISSSKDMDTAILQSMADISAFQPNGATLEELWTFFRAAFRMPGSFEDLKLLKEKLHCGIESMKTWDKITVKNGRYSLPAAIPTSSEVPPASKAPLRNVLSVHPSGLQFTDHIAPSAKVDTPSTASISSFIGLSVSSSCFPVLTTDDIPETNRTAPLPKTDKDVVVEKANTPVSSSEATIVPKEQSTLPVLSTANCKREVSVSFKIDSKGIKRQRVDTVIAPVEQKHQAITGGSTSSAQTQVPAPFTRKQVITTVESSSKVARDTITPDIGRAEPMKAQSFLTGDLIKLDSSEPFKLQSVPKTESIVPTKTSFAVPTPASEVQFCDEWVPPLNFTLRKPVAGVNNAPVTESTQNVVIAEPAAVIPVAASLYKKNKKKYKKKGNITVDVTQVQQQFWLDVEKARSEGSLSDEIYNAVQQHCSRKPSVHNLMKYKDFVLKKGDEGKAAQKLKEISPHVWNTPLAFTYLIWRTEMEQFVSQLHPNVDEARKLYLRKKAEFTVMEHMKRLTSYEEDLPGTHSEPNMVTPVGDPHLQNLLP